MITNNEGLNYGFSKRENIWREVSVLFTVVLFSYAAISKLINYEQSRNQMLNQVFPRDFAMLLTWAVPSVELINVLCLSFKRTVIVGLWFSLTLMISFTIYIILGLLNAFSRMPCSCGGILENMGWETHLFFNVACILIIIIGLILSIKERRIGDTR